MKTLTTAVVGLGLALALVSPAHAQRPDAIWARSTNGAPITLDGFLNEPGWAVAESTVVRFGIDAGVPGSGSKFEAGRVPIDSTYAVLKFLVVGNQLYLGARVRDQSVGGSADFNLFDGLLMDVKKHSDAGFPKPPNEYLYSWWYPDQVGTPPTGQAPSFKGAWAELPVGSPRTPAQIDAWDAVTRVQGISNSDAALDTGYVVEMKFNLTPMGYDVTQAAGDIVEWNVSIYDCDWNWPLDALKFSANRVWWQDPWGNVGWYGQVRIHAKPSVTIASGPAPPIQPELLLPNAGALAAPVVDGNLNDPVWAQSPHFDLRYGDDANRATYPNIARFRSGQFQPQVNGDAEEFLPDPGDATVRYVIKGNTLYFGFDVRDIAVQYITDPERWDGFSVMLNEKVLRNPDRALMNRKITFQVGPGGTVLAQDFLPFLKDTLFGAQVALLLKAGTTVDTLGTNTDAGYTAELSVDLTKLGYPNGLGDGIVHLGVVLYDGDSFTPFTDSYSTRTWFMRERDNVCCPIWAYADPTAVVAVGDPGPTQSGGYLLLAALPNPTRWLANVRYSMPSPGRVSLTTYDAAGRTISTRDLGVQAAGVNQTPVPRTGSPGVVFYRLRMVDPSSGVEQATLGGKLTFVK